MKILFFVSGSVKSNFSYRPAALAASLHSLGHETAIVAPKADKYNNFIPEAIHELNGVKIIQPFQFTTRRLEINLIPYLFGAIRALFRERPDLIYIYKPTPISVIGMAGKLFFGTPVITDFDDLGSEVMKIEGHPIHQRKLVEWSEKISARHADRLVVASSYLGEIYGKQFPQKPLYFLPNGVDASWLTAMPRPSAEKYRIVFLGSLNRRSILEPLFDALPAVLAQVPTTKILVMGDGKELPYFKEKVSKLGVAHAVSFTGWLTLSDAQEKLHANDIGYCYMPREKTVKAASNMKISQYMARGVVPLVSDVNESSDDKDFATAAYVAHANDVGDLTKTILSALQDSSRVEKGARSREFAVTHFAWDSLAHGFDQWITGRGEKRAKKKIYVVTISVPGEIGGGEIRNLNLVKQLERQVNAEVEIFSIAPRENIADAKVKCESETGAKCHIATAHQRNAWSTFSAIAFKRMPPFMDDFRASGIGTIFRTQCEAALPDFVQLEQLEAYYCIRKYIPWLKKQGVKIVFDCHNVEFMKFQESLSLFSPVKRWVGRYLLPHYRKMEIEAARRADMVFACSSLDADFFRQYCHATRVVPNGVDCGQFGTHLIQNEPILLFVGGVGYPPNSDAMEFYLKEVHPKVKERVPTIKLRAVGMDARWLHERKINDPSVEALGFVEDIRPFLRDAAIGICPIRVGSGTRIKILTYMAAGLPTISTAKGAEGVPYENRKDIMIADHADDFAKAIVNLLKDPEARSTMGENGRAFVCMQYDWNVIGKELKDAYTYER